jgi:hypothetical protein
MQASTETDFDYPAEFEMVKEVNCFFLNHWTLVFWSS